ncbi:hypothetical protein BDV41DRAFT_577532 [Aspergillus transmontanensis]|uniref:Uncharacterized protein n=1 Tax=Aspergillus transmontanensis TaxID=1034304 RepID=A0A5N6VW57_9EURO|nr:hypothetical protein BDV41DRAFT_577532 [Aspergillus transmontanensis]
MKLTMLIYLFAYGSAAFAAACVELLETFCSMDCGTCFVPGGFVGNRCMECEKLRHQYEATCGGLPILCRG